VRRVAGAVAVLALLSACSPSADPPAASPTSPPSTGSPPAAAGSTGATAPASRSAALGLEDWATYHRTPDRAGAVRPGPRPRTLSVGWSAELDGAVYGQPLVLGSTVVAATEGDSLYALDARTGRVRWRTNVGTPVPLADLPCGNIDPLGITGTPVYDPVHHRVLAVAEVAGFRHVLVGVDLADGRVTLRRPVDPPEQDPTPMQQRGALLLAHDRVYVAYGGLAGDCGDYHGHVVAVATDGSGPLLSWRVPTPREGGIWAASGPALGPDGHLYVAVGNGESTSQYDGSDSVTELDADLRRTDFFAPTVWADDNAHDLDLGSMGPAVLADGSLAVAGKRGVVYLLRRGDLGGIGGQRAQVGGCAGFGGAAVVGMTVYLPCTDGVLALDASSGRLRTLWRAPAEVFGSPTVAGDTVWALAPDAEALVALDRAGGGQLARLDVGAVSRFATPVPWRDLVFLPTLRGVLAAKVG